jgi:chitinase
VGRVRKATTNEVKHPHIVELAAGRDGLDVELSRRIMQFHKSQRIQPRHGRRITAKRGRLYYRWCFSDLLIARAFVEQFGGEICKARV